jgi:hypothetical protein
MLQQLLLGVVGWDSAVLIRVRMRDATAVARANTRASVDMGITTRCCPDNCHISLCTLAVLHCHASSIVHAAVLHQRLGL